MTPESAGTPTEKKQMDFPLTIRNEEQLLKLAHQLAEKLVALKNPPIIQELNEEETAEDKLKRCQSAPDLSKQ